MSLKIPQTLSLRFLCVEMIQLLQLASEVNLNQSMLLIHQSRLVARLNPRLDSCLDSSLELRLKPRIKPGPADRCECHLVSLSLVPFSLPIPTSLSRFPFSLPFPLSALPMLLCIRSVCRSKAGGNKLASKYFDYIINTRAQG